tara:strand:- start:481 stop:873 length:393 start_codon:yes stop_codon:yes gene_type:complete
MLRESISIMVKDIISNSNTIVKKENITNINNVQLFTGFVISMSEQMKKDCEIIKNFLNIYVYNHNKLKEKRLKVEKITKKLFNYYDQNFNKLPEDWYNLERDENKYRIICDYISGMTDRYASKLYISLYE